MLATPAHKEKLFSLGSLSVLLLFRFLYQSWNYYSPRFEFQSVWWIILPVFWLFSQKPPQIIKKKVIRYAGLR
jgi:hypothetical protein